MLWCRAASPQPPHASGSHTSAEPPPFSCIPTLGSVREALNCFFRPAARVIETCVLAVNEDGPRSAGRRGVAEVERYALDGESDEWADLRLAPGGHGH